MNLSDLLKGIDLTTSFVNHEAFNFKVTDATCDSQQVQRNSLFVAIPGTKVDGHNFIEEAIKAQANVVIGEKDIHPQGVLYLKTTNARKAYAQICANWFNHPSQKLRVIGVTGTDGKTTTVNLIHHLFQEAPFRVGSISTISAQIGNQTFETGLHTTTPDPKLLQEFLAKMVKQKIKVAVLEATSHGLDQKRLTGIDFETAVLTNLTHDHLDYHQTLEKYKNAKAELFEKARQSVLNADDQHFKFFRQASQGKILTYGFKNRADVMGYKLKLSSAGLSFQVQSKLGKKTKRFELKSLLWGEFNAYNILAATTTALLYGIEPNLIAKTVAEFRPPLGRLEMIDHGQDFTVLVDFAHTPNALEKVLTCLRSILKEEARLVCVFGCAGERDPTKRPVMGKIATKLADFTVLTAEDPRSESLVDILEQIARGCEEAGGMEGKTWFKIPDRTEAISFAINKLARRGDVVVICGKGHERSLCFGETEIPWSDQETAREILKKRSKRVNR